MVSKPHNYAKGMFKNTHPQNQPADTYRDAKNIQIESIEGDVLSLINEDGNTARVILGNDALLAPYVNGYDYRYYTCIGHTVLVDEIIVFLTGKNNWQLLSKNVTSGTAVTTGTNDQFSEIGIIKRNLAGVWEYQMMLNDTINSVYNRTTGVVNTPYTNIPANFGWGLLNFKINKPIDAEARKLYNGHRIVYFVDDHNINRAIDLDRDYTVDPYDVTSFDAATSLFLESPITNPINPVVNDAGGSITTGAYMFTARMVTQNLGTSPFGFVSNPIYVTDNTGANTPHPLNYDGAPIDTPTNKSISIDVEGIDQNFAFVDLAVIRFQGITNTPLVEVVKRVAITASTMSFTYTGSEEIVEIISEADVITPAIDYSTAKCIEQKDGILFLSNLKSDSTTDNWQEVANSIEFKYTVEEVEANTGTTVNQSLNDYKGTKLSFDKKGFQRGEVYSLSFIPIYKNGSAGSAYHIPARAITPSTTYGSPATANVNLANTSTQELGTFYQATLTYDPNGDIATQPNFISSPVLFNNFSRVRHHVMPNLSQEPHFINKNGSLFIRVLGLEISNIIIPSSLETKLAGYIIGRQQRDDNPTANKRYMAQGVCNRLIKYNVGSMANIRAIASPPAGSFSNTMDTGLTPSGGYWNSPATTTPPNRTPEGIPSRGNEDFYETSYLFGSTTINWGGKTAPRHGYRWGQSNLNDNNGYENDKINFYSPETILNGVDGPVAGVYEIENSLQLSGVPHVDKFDKTKLKLPSNALVIAAEASFVIAFGLAGGFSAFTLAFISGFAAYLAVLGAGYTQILEAFRLNAICDYFGSTSTANGKYTVINNHNLVTVTGDEGGFNVKINPVLGNEAYWGNENNGGWLMKLSTPLIGQDRTTQDGVLQFDPDSQWNMWGNGNGEGYANESYNPDVSHSKGLFNALRDLPDQYGDINQAEYVKCGFVNDISLTSGIKIFGGDTYVGYFSVVNSSKLRYDIATMRLDKIGPANFADTNLRFEGVEVPPASTPSLGKGGELKSIMGFFVESTKNVEYRHKIQNGVTYWPVEYDQSLPNIGRNKVYDQPWFLGHTGAYNKIYSKDNSLVKYFPPSLISSATTGTEFETRTIYSTGDSTDTVVDNYRIFPVFNYHDIPKNTGPIWDTFVINNELVLHTTRSMWKTYVNDSTALIGTNEVEVKLGTGGLFNRPSIEIISSKGGYAGIQHHFGGVNTPFGRIFVDAVQGKVFIYDSQLKEISSPGLTQYITNVGPDYTTANTPDLQMDCPYTDKLNYFGILMGYDNRYKTAYLTVRRWLSYPQVVDFVPNHTTLSYNFNTNAWVSQHDYHPNMYIGLGRELLLIKNIAINHIAPVNTPYSKFYTVRDNAKGVFFETPQPYTSSIEIVINDDVLDTKLVDSLTLDQFTTDSNSNNVNSTFSTIIGTTETQSTGSVNISQQNLITNPVIPANTVIARYLESKYNIPIPRENITSARMRGKYLIIKLIFNNSQNYNTVINAITANYRISIR